MPNRSVVAWVFVVLIALAVLLSGQLVISG